MFLGMCIHYPTFLESILIWILEWMYQSNFVTWSTTLVVGYLHLNLPRPAASAQFPQRASCLPNAVDTQCLSRTLYGIWQHCSRPGFWFVTVLHACRQLALLLLSSTSLSFPSVFCPPLMHCCLLGLVFVIIPRSSCVPVTSRWIYSIHASLPEF